MRRRLTGTMRPAGARQSTGLPFHSVARFAPSAFVQHEADTVGPVPARLHFQTQRGIPLTRREAAHHLTGGGVQGADRDVAVVGQVVPPTMRVVVLAGG